MNSARVTGASGVAPYTGRCDPRSAAARPVLDDEGLAKALRQPLADQPGDDVVAVPGTKPTISRTVRAG